MTIENYIADIAQEYKNRLNKTIEKEKSYSINVLNFNEPEKIFIAEAKGSKITDYDGNTYIDTSMGYGTFILGHSPNEVKEVVSRQLEKGTLFSSSNFNALELAESIKQATSFDDIVFCNTGSEATMRAIRIARAFNKKNKVGIFSGGWHGSHDGVLVEDDFLNEEKLIFKSSGIPNELLDLCILLPYNDERAFDIIKKNKDELSLVIIEPSQGSNPRDDVRYFLRELKNVTKENDVLLCFDEIITGFRIDIGGGKTFHCTDCDLATYGKIIGGGFPIGVVAGKSEIMKTIFSSNPSVFLGGTFSGNPISTIAGNTVLSILLKEEEKIYNSLFEKGKTFKKILNSFFEEKNLPIRVIGIGSMLRVVFTDFPILSRRDRDNHEVKNPYFRKYFSKAMANKGIFIPSNGITFLSTEHTTEDIKTITDVYKEVISNFNSGGVFNEFNK